MARLLEIQAGVEFDRANSAYNIQNITKSDVMFLSSYIEFMTQMQNNKDFLIPRKNSIFKSNESGYFDLQDFKAPTGTAR